MRELKYSVRGIETTSYVKAMELAHGNELNIRVILEDVPQPKPQLSAKRLAYLATLGKAK